MSLTAPRYRMPTGVDELTPIRTVSPIPEHLRVSVSSGRTQVDITLPANARVADILPYLVRLIADHERTGEEPASIDDERTSRNTLTRGSQELPADRTLREAGVRHGDVLTLCAEPTLLPPIRYDDVVDAAAQLNRASYASWGPTSAAVMAIVALYACVGILGWMSLDMRFDPARPVIVGLDLAGSLALVAAATVAQRMYSYGRVAAVLGWAAILLAGAASLAIFAGLPGWGVVATCGAVIVLSYGAYRLIGAGGGGYLAGALYAAVMGVVVAVRTGFGVTDDRLGVAVCLVTLLLCWAVPRVTAGWDRFDLRTGSTAAPVEALDDPFGTVADRSLPDRRQLVETVPTADEIRERGRAAVSVRAALYVGCGAALVSGMALLLTPWGQPRWPDLAFGALCAVVFGLRVRLCRSAAEQSGVLLTAAVAIIITCVAATAGPPEFAATGLAGLGLIVAGGAATAVFMGPARSRRRDRALDYLNYLAVAALVPVALAVLGLYTQLRAGGL
ncbi:hypothetical protein AFM11_14710 [Mycolicibacterium wolinskyi]|uniref:EccD-like transmembrane domain-containing protein n=1 Tax=Mycolicibacterium wolinskyi TaxID=59750 RepID=A0A132PMU2_9MYCO|nr:type VII secretion integral membrane protein EccD [Mycolicibacterium wolinskyi]KWX23517.1 hypothetical protein AFM11_14710 [Mycolicibacterium wolinskyi]